MLHTSRPSDRAAHRGVVVNVSPAAHSPFAPSVALLRAYQRGRITWAAFAVRYRGEMRARYRQAPGLFYGVAHRAAAGDVTLVCCELGQEATVACHRRLLRAYLGKVGETMGLTIVPGPSPAPAPSPAQAPAGVTAAAGEWTDPLAGRISATLRAFRSAMLAARPAGTPFVSGYDWEAGKARVELRDRLRLCGTCPTGKERPGVVKLWTGWWVCKRHLHQWQLRGGRVCCGALSCRCAKTTRVVA